MSTLNSYLFDPATGTVVDTVPLLLGWNGPLAQSYYEAEKFPQFGATGTVTLKGMQVAVASPSAIDFEVVSRATDGTVAIVATGTFPANTLECDAASLNLSVASVPNPVATTGYSIRPVGGFVASALRPGLFQLPAALQAVIGTSSGLTATFQLAIQ
jgi:hypothetical protein